MMRRADARGGYTQQKTSVIPLPPIPPPISGTKRNTSKHAGCRGAQVEHKRNKVEQQVEQTGGTAAWNRSFFWLKLGFFIARGYPILMMNGVRQTARSAR